MTLHGILIISNKFGTENHVSLTKTTFSNICYNQLGYPNGLLESKNMV